MTSSATSADEAPVFFASGDADLFGILTKPTVTPNGVAVVLLFGGIYTLSVNRNRLSVRLARRLAALGYHVLRLDLHGTGESTGMVEEYALNVPFAEDLAAAATWLEGLGISEVALVGSCFGGRTCLAGAERISLLKGLALVSTPVLDYEPTDVPIMRISKLPLRRLLVRIFRRHFIRHLFDRVHRQRYRGIAGAKIRAMRGQREQNLKERISPSAVKQLAHVVSRDVPVFIVYGTEPMREEFEHACKGRLGDVLRDKRNVDVRLFDDMRMHGFPSLESQQRAMTLVEDWLESLPIRDVQPTVASREP